MYKISIESGEIENMPQGVFPGKIHVIEKTGLEYAKAIAYLMTQKVIGFDTETRPVFTPGHRHHHVALLQLSGADRAFLFRLNKIGMRRMMCTILSNPSIVKVGAAVHDDLRGLQYHHKFVPRNFVDLQKIGYLWGIRDKSVKKMSAIILGRRISKTQQLSNWEAEKLSQAQEMYAATDAWICREMYLKLMRSEQHPLTPEQMAPQPAPQKPVEAGEPQAHTKDAASVKAPAAGSAKTSDKAPAKASAKKKDGGASGKAKTSGKSGSASKKKELKEAVPAKKVLKGEEAADARKSLSDKSGAVVKKIPKQ